MFTKIDLKDAYLQVPLDEESQQYTVVNTHRGLFAATRLVFGIASAPAIFQKHMEQIVGDMDGVAVFLDDLCITGKTEDQNRINVREVLRRLAKEGLRINPSKCHWSVPSVTYLGYRLSAKGVEPQEEKVAAV